MFSRLLTQRAPLMGSAQGHKMQMLRAITPQAHSFMQLPSRSLLMRSATAASVQSTS